MSESQTHNDELHARFQRTDAAHPEVWRLFLQFTFELINRGRTRCGAALVFERIRWESQAGGDGVGQFKIDNNHKAFYVRKFAELYPEHANFFDTRVQTSKTKPPRRCAAATPLHIACRNKP